MTSPIYGKGGQRLSSLLMAWTTGMPKVAATGILENGTDICNLYAPRSQGTAPANTGILKNGADIAGLFAKNGSAPSALSIDGSDYRKTSVRAAATLAFAAKSDGTFAVTANGNTVASGTWLPAGGSVSQFTVKYTGTGFTNQDDPSGGVNTFSNGAATASALTTTRSFSCSAAAITVDQNAENAGTLLIEIFKSGVLNSSTQIGFDCISTGF